ncbi:related to EMP24 protein precursor [Ustilago trichophora]|uniref:Related to EMP24 protein n=1 Tax=Ustilago trichophora TaxID=86804 RepID=A0A5C3E592_9BASI|nr:related to EMP24 protein precursor [Ustilago trichophora]
MSRFTSLSLLASAWAFAILLILTLAPNPSTAHMIELGPHSSECFFEDLHNGDQMTLTYQVGGGGHLDIDVALYDPKHRPLFKQDRKDTGTYSFTAQDDGRYSYCFSNEFSSVSDKTVSFNVHGIIYVPDEGDMLPIEREIRDLAAGLQAVKDEQEYLVIRERVHRNTAESTNTRVKWWSIIQGFILVVVCSCQVYFVKRHFEVKRVV